MNEKTIPDAPWRGMRPSVDASRSDNPAYLVIHRLVALWPNQAVGVRAGLLSAADIVHLIEEGKEGVRDGDGSRRVLSARCGAF
jgi:hypothetical protein